MDYEKFIKSIKKMKIDPLPAKKQAAPVVAAPPQVKKIINKPQVQQPKSAIVDGDGANRDGANRDDDIFIIKATDDFFVPDPPPKEQIKMTPEEIRKQKITDEIYAKVYLETKQMLAKEREEEERAKKLGIYVEPSRKQMQKSAPIKYSAFATPASDLIREQRGGGRRNY
jgi:hypothetical protein